MVDKPILSAKDPITVKKVDFNETIMEVNKLLIGHADAVRVGLFKAAPGTEGPSHYYKFIANSNADRQARNQIRQVLNNLWQSGAYSFHQIAEALRLDDMDIQGLMDEEFIRNNNLG